MGPLHTRFFYAGVIDRQVVLHGGYPGMGDQLPGLRIGQIRFGLCQTQFKLRVFYHKQRIAFMHRLVLLKTNLLDEALYPCIDGSNVLLHLGIVRVFHVSQVEETRTNIYEAGCQQGNDHGIVNQLLGLSCNHNVSEFIKYV